MSVVGPLHETGLLKLRIRLFVHDIDPESVALLIKLDGVISLVLPGVGAVVNLQGLFSLFLVDHYGEPVVGQSLEKYQTNLIRRFFEPFNE